jgi:hypothetical protein
LYPHVIVTGETATGDVVAVIVSVTLTLLSLAAAPAFSAAVNWIGMLLAPEVSVFAEAAVALEQPALELTVNTSPAVFVAAVNVTAAGGVILRPGTGTTPTTIE